MGDNIYLGDRNGVRTPMQWSSDKNAGFSRANPQLLYLPITVDPEYHYETVNVETQQGNPQSLLWWMKRLIALRKRHPAFGRGDMVFLNPVNAKVVAFVRTHGDERILVVANLSRFAQAAELDLSAYRGMTPVEMFGMNPLPPIGKAAYMLTLSPHGFYWLLLREPAGSAPPGGKEERLPVLDARGPWARLPEGRGREALERLLLRYLPAQRWFGGKARIVRDMKIEDAVPVPTDSGPVFLSFVHTDYNEGVAETYMLPLGFATGPRAERLLRDDPWAAIATLHTRENGGVQEGLLFDALADPAFGQALLAMVLRRRQHKGRRGILTAGSTWAMRRLDRHALVRAAPRPLSLEQSNTNLNFADTLILKVFRRVDEGVNPELEIGRMLTEQRRFEHVAPLAGYLEYELGHGRTISVAALHGFVPNHGNAWQFTLDELARYYEHVQTNPEHMLRPPGAEEPLAELAAHEATEQAQTYVGTYLESARLLGQRTAELHTALADAHGDETFGPEEFSTLYQRSLYQSQRTHTGQVLSLLRGKLRDLPAHLRPAASALLAREGEVLARFRRIVGKKLKTVRIRCHGDYHLGQVLFTGRDFVILDFEGEPARPVGERRIKRSPLRDVAGMLRSFDYAAHAALKLRTGDTDEGREQYAALAPWAHYWAQWSGSRFLRAYLETMAGKALLPDDPDDMELMLDMYRLDKALYELAYELNNRPDWADIPLHGLTRMLDGRSARSSARR
ncbi:MAG: putative maltokinase [Candidatus Lambdaproteobacteria bacterium]|nr:putative maltokinase [Candidatus Lambdaproteobacteria bacterium]